MHCSRAGGVQGGHVVLRFAGKLGTRGTPFHAHNK
ncbi:hypothetical protein chiPu_0025874, partial [Chiloscyllium punctatum]|nr:hypothetical protein [Chiloscyllium punctatum]